MNAAHPPRRTDVVIVGGGIVGCATAYYLSRRGRTVQILERGLVGSEQSSRAWGLLRQQGRHDAETPLAAEAARMWPGLPQELGADIELVQRGILLPAESEADEARMVDGERASRAHGVDSRLLGPAAVASLIPDLGGAWRAGLFTPGDGHVEPVKATRAYAAAARRLGVRIEEGTPACGIETTGGAATGVVTAQGIYHGDAILCAAGVGAAELSRTLGLALPIEIVRAPVSQTHPARRTTDIAVWAPHAAFRPRADGTYYLGNGYRGIDAEYDFTPDMFRHLRHFLPTYAAHRDILRLHLGRPFLEAMRRRVRPDARFAPWSEPAVNARLVAAYERGAYELLPHLAARGIARSWAGRIDATPDLIPILGRAPGIDRYYVAAGFNGHGLALSPAVARLLCELIVDGRPSLELHRFRIERFAEGRLERAGGAL